ncbi:MAG: ABC transporter [Desulfuromonas sp.]|nr:ABC transporter [Desulfuromonas sp.]
MTVLRDGLKTQVRVVRALMLRETKTLFGKHKLGYVWAFIQAAFLILIFWALRSRGNMHPPFGISSAVFLLGGFIPWFFFSEAVNRSINAIGGNMALLAYPQVFPLDLIIARTLLVGATYFCVMVLFLALLGLYGYPVTLDQPAMVLLSLALTLALSFGVGSICSALNVMQPTTARIVPMLLRIMFFTSGLFFSLSELPLSLQEILYYNPLSHVIELLRNGFASSYPRSFVSLPYVTGFALVTLALGLLLERYSRQFIDRES